MALCSQELSEGVNQKKITFGKHDVKNYVQNHLKILCYKL